MFLCLNFVVVVAFCSCAVVTVEAFELMAIKRREAEEAAAKSAKAKQEAEEARLAAEANERGGDEC